eukprot:TRINITY_DN36549_c0_g1_i2.p2 TRINITY_DN36549_c0_g1~~TRINITY_DN36549_c0_g1_i2.p2  ORF type:complete len:169 (-),score=34.42 TRINITY_DN36549_c0_g1_i2:98-604(-)
MCIRDSSWALLIFCIQSKCPETCTRSLEAAAKYFPILMEFCQINGMSDIKKSASANFQLLLGMLFKYSAVSEVHEKILGKVLKLMSVMIVNYPGGSLGEFYKSFFTEIKGKSIITAENIQEIAKSEVEDIPKIIGTNYKTFWALHHTCLLYTSPSPRDLSTSRMPSSA